jgi:hypothetical protein
MHERRCLFAVPFESGVLKWTAATKKPGVSWMVQRCGRNAAAKRRCALSCPFFEFKNGAAKSKCSFLNSQFLSAHLSRQHV